MVSLYACSMTPPNQPAPTSIITEDAVVTEEATVTENVAYPYPFSDANQQEIFSAGGYPAPIEETPVPTKGVLPQPPDSAPQPQSGKASISGVIYSPITQHIIPETAAYLAPGWGELKQDPPIMLVGPREETGDIGFRTDMNGQFFINNIEPGTYYLLVWAPYDWLFGQNSAEDITPRKITLAPDQMLELGIVYVAY